MKHHIYRAIDRWIDQPPWPVEFAAVFWGAVSALFWVCIIQAALWVLS